MTKTMKKTEAAGIEEHLEDINISGVMEDSFKEYAAAVVVSRAIADVRDGLKPVHRRILFTMKLGGYDWTAGYRKSARIVGDTMGMVHPHGDSAIYDAMARLTQPWSVTAPLIDGQGNFGTPDGDNPAAMRYTEARLAPISRFLLEEINRDTVDFRPNYDGTIQEPVVLPAAFPNVLVNGGSGIAVGIASSVPPHNLGEVIDATLARLRNPEIGLAELMQLCPAPDLPTGGRIIGTEGIVKAYATGRGTMLVEATTHFEMDGKNPLIVYNDMPWGKERPKLLERINSLILDKKMPDILSARDETGREGERFVVELQPGADAALIDRQLKLQTDLRCTISLNFTLLDGRGMPREMGLADILDEWIAFRRLTIRRRATFDLRKARDRGRLMLGRIAALSIIDRMVKLIRSSKSREEAIEAICALSFNAADFADLVDLLGTRDQKKGKRFQLIRAQAEDILAMRLQRLTGMERESLEEESRKLVAQIRELKAILSIPSRLDDVLAEELEAVRGAVPSTARRSVIDAEARILSEDSSTPMTPCQPTTVLIGHDLRLSQTRKPVPEDFIGTAVATDSHARIVIFTADGTAYGLDAEALPRIDDKEDPRPVPGLIGLSPSGPVVQILCLNGEELAEDNGATLCFVSEDGAIRRTRASEFARIPQAGKMAMKLADSDPRLLCVIKETRGLNEAGLPLGGALFMGTQEGRFIRFSLADVRVMAGRGSRGIRGMKLEGSDRIVSAFELPDLAHSVELTDEVEKASIGKIPARDLGEAAKALLDAADIVQIASSGHAKRTISHAYRQTRRDNRGINDKGPAKTIGQILCYRPGRPGECLHILVPGQEEPLKIDVADIRKAAKATTGMILAEKIDRVL